MTDIPADLRQRCIEDLEADEKLRPCRLRWGDGSFDDGGYQRPRSGWWIGSTIVGDDVAAALLRDAYMRRLADFFVPVLLYKIADGRYRVTTTGVAYYYEDGSLLAALQAAYRGVKEAATDGDSTDT